MIRPAEWNIRAKQHVVLHHRARVVFPSDLWIVFKPGDWCALAGIHLCIYMCAAHTLACTLKFNYGALRNQSGLIGFLSGWFSEMNRAEIHRNQLLISLLNEAHRCCHWRTNVRLCSDSCAHGSATFWGQILTRPTPLRACVSATSTSSPFLLCADIGVSFLAPGVNWISL